MAQSTPTSAVARFVRVDLIGGLAGLAFVIVANVAFVRTAGVWLVLPALITLIGCLVVAQRRLPDGLLGALTLVAAGNWLAAVVVSALFPFLWPPMVLTVLLPLVLATPFLDRPRLQVAIGAAAAMMALIGAIGLINDDGGVIADIDDSLEFLVVIGALIALTIPIALVIRQNNALQRDATEQLARSRRRVVEASDAERSRIERDLHDGAQQRLLAMRMRLQLLSAGVDGETQRSFAELTADLDAAISELRDLARGIYPPELVANGLADALNSAVRRSPPRFMSTIELVDRLSAPVEQALYFTGLEAMSNAAKHTAGSVAVELRQESGLVELVVVDEGPGFDVERVAGSVGLASMVDRIDAAGGEITITSSGRGTQVRVTVAVSPPV